MGARGFSFSVRQVMILHGSFRDWDKCTAEKVAVFTMLLGVAICPSNRSNDWIAFNFVEKTVDWKLVLSQSVCVCVYKIRASV